MAEIIPILRLAVLIGWALVILFAAPAWGRVVRGSIDQGDLKQVALAVTGVALVGFQVNAMWGGIAPRTDYWSAAFLLLLAIAAAIVIFCVHVPRTPPGHKRAVVLTHLGILGLCIVMGGILA